MDDVCDLFDIKEDIYGHILVALTEAVNNSLQHGNKANPDKHIEVTFKVKDNKLFFTVKDKEGAEALRQGLQDIGSIPFTEVLEYLNKMLDVYKDQPLYVGIFETIEKIKSLN